MRPVYLVLSVVVVLLVSSIPLALMGAAASDEADNIDGEIVTRDFSFRAGEGVRIGDYRVELLSVVSVIDGLVEVRVYKRASQFEDWRVMQDYRDVNFDGGKDRGGLTLTVVEIFDIDTVRMRAAYRSDYGYPQKYVTERALAPRNLPELKVFTTVDKTTVSTGDELKVTITVTNAGNDTARDVVIQDSPPLPQFRYLAGYPPKVKNQLQPGESDIVVYSMVAAAEGSVELAGTAARYSDSKATLYSATSQPVNIEIRPQRRPDLAFEVEAPGPIELGGEGAINVTIKNDGEAAAQRVEVKMGLRSGMDGLEFSGGGLDRSFFEIAPGDVERYSATVRGSRSGSYVVDLSASYRADGEMMQEDTSFQVSVLEREYKYLYYLPIVPVLIIGIWLYRRYKEYKY